MVSRSTLSQLFCALSWSATLTTSSFGARRRRRGQGRKARSYRHHAAGRRDVQATPTSHTRQPAGLKSEDELPARRLTRRAS